MLNDFIKTNRDEIVARTRSKVAERSAPRPTQGELTSGVPLFLDQLAERLRGEAPSQGDIGVSATAHGKEMLRQGFSIAQVVQDYGDVCQAVTELALARDAPITTAEFRTLNRCVDMATAEAVSEYEHQRDLAVSDEGTERLGILAHELRNQLSSAVMAFDIIKRGSVGVGGSVGAVLGRSLSGLRDTIDRTLAEVRLESGIKKNERIRVQDFIEEVEVIAAFEANTKGLRLTVACGDDGAEVEIDRHILASAVGNLLQNAFKFTHEDGNVTLRTCATADRVLIDIEDECGGLPPGSIEGLFKPYEQRGTDRTGLGLGLAISQRGVKANGGDIHVRDLPGKGCVFTVDLPRANRQDAADARTGSLGRPKGELTGA
jgi:signal transduction histidine kinase